MREPRSLLDAFLAFARWRAAIAAALIALGAVFDGLGLLLLVPVLDLVVGTHGGQGRGPIGGLARGLLGGYPPATRLLIALAVFSILMFVRGAVLHQRDRLTQTLQLGFVEDVRLRFARKLASAGWPAVAAASQARILQALSVEIHQVGVASDAALLAAVALAMLIGHCVLALVLAPLAGLLAVAFVLAGAVISGPYLKRSKSLGRTIIEAHLGMAGGAAAFMGSLKLALAQGLEQRFVAGYAAAAASSVRDRVEFHRLKSRLRNLTSGAAALAGAATVFAGVEVFHLPAAVLITLLVVLSRMGALAASVQNSAQQIMHSLPAYGAILALEAELEAPRRSRASAIPVRPVAGRGYALVFSRVGFARGTGRGPILTDLSLAIPAGAFVGVAGPSGTGKTTLLDLAAGVLRPDAGAISAFGEALDGEALAGHRERLAYVAQDSFLFDDTVRANLAWSAAGRTEAEMLEALGQVGAGELMKRLDRGLDTRIGHRGVLLSAGERQRIALAGALLRRPRLLLLDEATNAIDIAGEERVLETLSALKPQATILLVSHRTESLRLCDRILELPAAVLRPGPAGRPGRSEGVAGADDEGGLAMRLAGIELRARPSA